MFELTEVCSENLAKIKVIGVGGGGGNAVNTMIASCLQGVDFINANTDAQALGVSSAPAKFKSEVKSPKGSEPVPIRRSGNNPLWNPAMKSVLIWKARI
jgi:cell division protein FtsZ